jgi:Kelch motif
MIVWGGASGTVALGNGKIYRPTTDDWIPMATLGAPSPRYHHSAVVIDDKMVIFGGYAGGANYFADGAMFDPATDTWTPLATDGAPVARRSHAAAAVGSKMVIFGGYNYRPELQYLSDGAIYDFGAATPGWIGLPEGDRPDGRAYATAPTASGDLVVIWGGRKDATYLDSGAVLRLFAP